VDGRLLWALSSGAGTTLVWFEGICRYELYGRSFVTRAALSEMARETAPLAELEGASE